MRVMKFYSLLVSIGCFCGWASGLQAAYLMGVTSSASGSSLSIFDDSGVLLETYGGSDALGNVVQVGDTLYGWSGSDQGTSSTL
jgi:hypothetical protein